MKYKFKDYIYLAIGGVCYIYEGVKRSVKKKIAILKGEKK